MTPGTLRNLRRGIALETWKGYSYTVKVADALRTIQESASIDECFNVYLACGFTPLHLVTFLAAELQGQSNSARIVVETGVFDDLVGNLGRMERSNSQLGVCVVEWPDLDPRLGVRRLSPWGYNDQQELEKSVQLAALRLKSALLRAAQRMRVIVVFPTLPLLPVSSTASFQVSTLEAHLRLIVAKTALELASESHIVLVRNDFIFGAEPIDSQSEIASGFPYTVAHASAVAEAIARHGLRPVRKNALITDLDDTLWKGILGEVGIANVTWNMDNKAQLHGLYQQLLHWLATEGVLIGVASKNSPELVRQVFLTRDDLLMEYDEIFPFEVHWGSKAESVSRILAKWHIHAESVLFVDDDPHELAEVKNSHPDIEAIPFPVNGAQFLKFWKRLRDAFAATSVRKEDVIRSQSLRSDNQIQEELAGSSDRESFLEQLDARIVFEISADAGDERAFQLVNKTNQFTINGTRYNESSWQSALGAEGAFLLTCSYFDKFGSLGKIAVLQGQVQEKRATIHAWVMSCRAFSRRIEFATLRELIRYFGVERVELAYKPTERNGPVREFLLALGVTTAIPVRVDVEQFEQACPQLLHQIEVQSRLTQRDSDG